MNTNINEYQLQRRNYLYSKILSAVVRGLEVTFVDVEIDVSEGIPYFQIVGSVSTEVKEAEERVRTALKNIGEGLQGKRIIGNLTPANIRKVGAAFDLPLAIAILASYGRIDREKLKGILVMGEVGLDGSIYPVEGILPVINRGKKEGIYTFMIPKGNVKEGAVVEGVTIYGVESLQDVMNYFKADALKPEQCLDFLKLQSELPKSELDYGDIQGQEFVKRAVQVGVAGSHNMLMIGPPGSGKSMIAQRIPTITPPLSFEESMDISQVYSIMGLLENKRPLIYKRPFRSVHHTTTKTALVGGGNKVRPGEISLAHEGILFLDELPEFPKAVLEVLRQPLEDNKIRITRTSGSYEFPAKIMMVAAMNPCPCGNFPDINRCNCSDHQISSYLGKISQPLLDRIDLCLEVPKVEYETLVDKKASLDSATMKIQVEQAIAIQKERYKGESFSCNANIPSNRMEEYCFLDENCQELMKSAYDRLDLTARTYYKILKVARTLADMEGVEKISTAHIHEAIGYRMIDKKYWGR